MAGRDGYNLKSNTSNFSSMGKLIVFILCVGFLFFAIESNLYKKLTDSSKLNAAEQPYVKHNIEEPHVSKSLREEPLTSQKGDLLYCNTQNPSGSEGPTFPGSIDWKLHHLLINIRHGDRSSIHNIPSAEKLVDQVKTNSVEFLSYSALEYFPKLNSFAIKPIGTQDQVVKGDLLDALNTSTIFVTSDSNLAPGILTTRGFMQHILLGRFLHTSYLAYVNTIQNHDELYVRSTNYRRTILSVAALLITLLPNLGGPKKEHQIPIQSYVEESDEIMHGIGLRLSSHLEHGGERSSTGNCWASAGLASHEKSMHRPDEANREKLKKIFGEVIKTMSSTDIADASYPRECQHFPFPCASDGNLCMNREIFLTTMNDANKLFCDRYTGTNGGMMATKLSIYPFMKEIKEVIFKSVTRQDSKEKITIFSGHDTVIAPVLAALGVYRQKDLCVWPPYASRIVFEIYIPAKQEPKEFTIEEARKIVHLRVLYNGRDITLDITECKSVITRGSPLCPLEAFEKQIDGLISPYKDIETACKKENELVYLNSIVNK